MYMCDMTHLYVRHDSKKYYIHIRHDSTKKGHDSFTCVTWLELLHAVRVQIPSDCYMKESQNIAIQIRKRDMQFRKRGQQLQISKEPYNFAKSDGYIYLMVVWRSPKKIGHDLFKCGTWLIRICNKNHIPHLNESCPIFFYLMVIWKSPNNFAKSDGYIYLMVTWRSQKKLDMTHSHVGHDSFICATWLMSHILHIWMSHVAHINESCPTFEWVMSIFFHLNVQDDSCPTFKWVMSNLFWSDGYMKESKKCRTWLI